MSVYLHTFGVNHPDNPFTKTHQIYSLNFCASISIAEVLMTSSKIPLFKECSLCDTKKTGQLLIQCQKKIEILETLKSINYWQKSYNFGWVDRLIVMLMAVQSTAASESLYSSRSAAAASSSLQHPSTPTMHILNKVYNYTSKFCYCWRLKSYESTILSFCVNSSILSG